MSEEPNSPAPANPSSTEKVNPAAYTQDAYDQKESQSVQAPVSAASAALPSYPKPKGFFWTGPKRYLRNCRPYYWLSIEASDLEKPGQSRSYVEALDVIVGEAVKTSHAQGQPFTDVFVLSHGWHRNLYSAASAYDRMVARFIMLSRSERLVPSKKPFVPLFICLHWHSDPGANQWMDGAGRRSKVSFMEKVRDHFHAEPVHPQTLAECEALFIKDFEALFEVMSRVVSTPEANANHVEYNEMQDAHSRIDRYRLVGSASACSTTRAEKTTVLWMCYHEAVARRRLEAQKDQASYGYLSWKQALGTLSRFITALVPIFAIAAGLFNFLKPYLLKFFSHIPSQVTNVPSHLIEALPNLGWLFSAPFYFYLSLIILLSPLYLLWKAWQSDQKHIQNPDKIGGEVHGFSIVLFISYAITQFLAAIPLLLSGFVSYLFGGFFAKYLWKKSLDAPGDERIGQRNKPVADQDIEDYKQSHRRWFSRGGYAYFARRPIRWLESIVASDSKLIDLTKTLDSQLAFYEMQNRGVQCGYLAGEAVTKLGHDGRAKGIFTTDTKFHFIGHSFGALVVANAVRTITQKDTNHEVHIKTLCFLQAALSSTWFDNEEAVLQRIEGNIANVYSKYDTATGFYYPLASFARTAAGNMGFMTAKTINGTIQPAIKPDTSLGLLVKPPSLASTSTPAPNASLATLLNLDASRIIYDGPVAMGGAHNDIFKDDVTHLIWAACEL